ncbi:TIGR00341 family protein [Patescibacteria group bacterium]|nr:TIGR00341 family protein [Candidatus Falkowbacteria bacterium]MBU3906617.1 TIGR00341 family protein [Patescibacteria group bacterium]MBU4015540.1 TIGR00341 family protein [Patescibacteria group bacterium]MBU4026508.1 TIGR00341 family protein [Patescibacteria group bacterium]MBU4073723.1 TIGR00341 family protein [Patescibacteria group bacterium]
MILKPAKLTKTQKTQAVEKLFHESAPNYDFFLMLILSAIIVTLGLLMNNIAIVIGGMLVAPILSPILSLSMGVVVGNQKLMKRSGLVILQSMCLIVLISLIMSFLAIHKEITPEIVARAYPSLSYFLIGLFSGGAVAFAMVRPSLSETLPGVAISVSLIPPLSALGIAISFFEWNMAVGALGLFLLNFIGIVFAALFVFAILRFYEVKEAIDKNIRAEERVMLEEKREKDKEKIEEIEKTVKEATEFLKEKKNGK